MQDLRTNLQGVGEDTERDEQLRGPAVNPVRRSVFFDLNPQLLHRFIRPLRIFLRPQY